MFSIFVVCSVIHFGSTNSQEITTNATTTELVLYMVRSKYDEWLNLANEIPELRKKLHDQRKAMKTRYEGELKEGDKIRHDLYLKIHYQKVGYEKDLWKLRHLKNSLIHFRYLSVLQNHIDEYERLAFLLVHFHPDMNLIKQNFQTKMEQAQEIRRQKWNYMLNHYSGFKIIRELICDINEAGIQHSDFSLGIARGYNLLLRKLRPNKLHEIEPTRILPDFSKNITGDFQVDRCFIVLMNDYAKKNKPKSDPSG